MTATVDFSTDPIVRGYSWGRWVNLLGVDQKPTDLTGLTALFVLYSEREPGITPIVYRQGEGAQITTDNIGNVNIWLIGADTATIPAEMDSFQVVFEDESGEKWLGIQGPVRVIGRVI